MKVRGILLASAFSLVSAGIGHAQSFKALVVTTCGQQNYSATINGAQNYAPFTVDLTGKICQNGSGGYTGSTATAPGTNGTTATPVQGVDGGKAVATSEAAGANVTLGSSGDPAAGTGNGTVISQLKQLHLDAIGPTFGTYNSTAPALTNGSIASLQLDQAGSLKINVASGVVSSFGYALSTSAAPSYANGGFNAVSQDLAGNLRSIASQGTPAAVGNAWPVYETQGGAALSATNGLPTTDTNASQTITAPGTAAAKAQAVQGVTNGIAVATSLSSLPAFAVTPTFKIDQTTPGTTNKVSIGTDGVVALGVSTANIGNVKGGYYSSSLGTLGGAGVTAVVTDKHAQTLSVEAGSDDPLAGITPALTQSGTSLVGKASQGNLYSAYAVNTTTTAGYLACIDAAAAPASSASITSKDVAYLSGAVGATATINYGAGPPNAYANGIQCVVTTSLTTYTPGGASFMSVRSR